MTKMDDDERKAISKLFSIEGQKNSEGLKSSIPRAVRFFELSKGMILYFLESKKNTPEKEFKDELVIDISSLLLTISNNMDEALTITDMIRGALEKIDQDIRKI